MLLATVNPAAAAAIGTIKKVGVGSRVVYRARAGMMRQGRTEFPADVLRQHPDDGSLDLYVIMEPEEIIMEQRVQFQSHNQPHHCWSVVQDEPGPAPLMIDAGGDPDDPVAGAVTYLPEGAARYVPPPQPDIGDTLREIGDRITALAKRVTDLERKKPLGRPRNDAPTEPEAG